MGAGIFIEILDDFLRWVPFEQNLLSRLNNPAYRLLRGIKCLASVFAGFFVYVALWNTTYDHSFDLGAGEDGKQFEWLAGRFGKLRCHFGGV